MYRMSFIKNFPMLAGPIPPLPERSPSHHQEDSAYNQGPSSLHQDHTMIYHASSPHWSTSLCISSGVSTLAAMTLEIEGGRILLNRTSIQVTWWKIDDQVNYNFNLTQSKQSMRRLLIFSSLNTQSLVELPNWHHDYYHGASLVTYATEYFVIRSSSGVLSHTKASQPGCFCQNNASKAQLKLAH